MQKENPVWYDEFMTNVQQILYGEKEKPHTIILSDSELRSLIKGSAIGAGAGSSRS